jgi:hypothetical protein
MPKAARRRTDNGPTVPSMESPTAVVVASGVSESDIARRAFELYTERGCEDGHDVDDWLKAERELRQAASSSAAESRNRDRR